MLKRLLGKKRLGTDDNLNSLPPEDNAEEVRQEFYCAKSGEGCGGYIRFSLEIGFNGKVTLICPKCGHRHARLARDGVLIGQGRGHPDDNDALEITPTIAAWSEEPWTKVYQELKAADPKKPSPKAIASERVAVVIDSSDKLTADAILKQSWFARED
jgi:hypothetical protein